MSDTYLSARHVLHLAQVITAVNEGRKVKWPLYNGDVVEGTLRGFTPNGSGAHFTGKDIRQSYIRITLKAGGDVWLETEEAAGMAEDGTIQL